MTKIKSTIYKYTTLIFISSFLNSAASSFSFPSKEIELGDNYLVSLLGSDFLIKKQWGDIKNIFIGHIEEYKVTNGYILAVTWGLYSDDDKITILAIDKKKDETHSFKDINEFKEFSQNEKIELNGFPKEESLRGFPRNELLSHDEVSS